MLIDSHCHLDPRTWGDDAGVDAVVARARAAGVDRMITIGSGYDIESARRAVAVARRHPDCVRASVGVHPHDAKDVTPAVLDELRTLAQAPEVVALGEMGLDFHYDSSPRDTQREVFRAQIALARELALPIIIHDRDTEGETLRVLDDTNAWEIGVLYHCYTGDVAHMEAIVSRGGYISIPGIVTFKNGDTMREVAAAVPAERVLVETDSPFLTPIPHRGKRNEPAYVGLVAAKVAEVRGLRTEVLAALAAENTRRFFRWA